MYESVAVLYTKWFMIKEKYENDNWEYKGPINGLVYLRKHISGDVNEESGWEKV